MSEKIRELFQAYLDDELTSELRRVVENYVACHPGARRELEELQAASQLLGGWRDADPPSAFRSRMAAAIRSDNPDSGRASDPLPSMGRSGRRPVEPGPASEPPPASARRATRQRWRWTPAIKAIGATAAVITVMTFTGKLFYRPGQAQYSRLSIDQMASVAAKVASCDELADMAIMVETAGIRVMAADSPDPAACALTRTAETITANPVLALDQRQDLRDVLRSLGQRLRPARADLWPLGRLYAADAPDLTQRRELQRILAFQHQGQFKLASQAYDAFVPTTNAERIHMSMRQAYCHLRLGDPERVRRLLGVVKSLDDVPLAYRALTQHMYDVLAEMEDARHYAARAASEATQPGAKPQTLRKLAQAELLCRRYGEAATNLRRYSDLTPDAEEQAVALVRSAWCLRMDGRFDDAYARLDIALGRVPKQSSDLEVWVQFERASMLLAQGRTGPALASLAMLHQTPAAQRSTGRCFRAAALFLCGYLRLYGREDGAITPGAMSDAAERFASLINLYPETSYARIAEGYLDSLQNRNPSLLRSRS